jgi:hypothetical protein
MRGHLLEAILPEFLLFLLLHLLTDGVVFVRGDDILQFWEQDG